MGTPKATNELDSVALETSLLSTWSDEKLFQKSVENRSTGEPFIFLEGLSDSEWQAWYSPCSCEDIQRFGL